MIPARLVCLSLALLLLLGCTSPGGGATPKVSLPSDPIAYAIEHRLPLAFTYHEVPRVVRPYRVGIARTGRTLLRAYELTRASEPSNAWKLYALEDIQSPSVRSGPSFTPAPGYTPSDKALPTILHQVPYTPPEN